MNLQQLLLFLLEVTTEASIPETTHNIDHVKNNLVKNKYIFYNENNGKMLYFILLVTSQLNTHGIMYLFCYVSQKLLHQNQIERPLQV